MSWFLLACLVTVLTSFVWTKTLGKKHVVGICSTSYRPDFFSAVHVDCHRDSMEKCEGTDPDIFLFNSTISEGNSGLSLGSKFGGLQTVANSNVSLTELIPSFFGAKYSRRYIHNLVGTNHSLQTYVVTVHLVGKSSRRYRYIHNLVGANHSRQTDAISLDLSVKKVNVLWIKGGILMVLVLTIITCTICCMRGICPRNNQEPLATSLPRSNSVLSGSERSQRPEARVRPFINQGTVSDSEESRPLLSPDHSPTSYSAVENPSSIGGSDHFVERLAIQNHSHPINVQGYNEYLRTAPTLDPNSITEDRSQWEDLEENVDFNIPVDDQFQIGHNSPSIEQCM